MAFAPEKEQLEREYIASLTEEDYRMQMYRDISDMRRYLYDLWSLVMLTCILYTAGIAIAVAYYFFTK